MNDSEGRKVIKFDLQDEQENEAFVLLDTVRYYQTRFITKLVLDFCAAKGLKPDSSYDEIRTVIKAYIKGYDSVKSNVSSTPESNNEIITMLLNGFMQQQTILQQMTLANTMPNINPVAINSVNNMDLNPPIKTELKPNNNLHQVVDNHTKPILQSEETISINNKITKQEDDDDEDDDDLSLVMNLAKGFSDMIQ